MSDTVLEAAAAEALAARARLLATAGEIQARLDPATLMDEAVTGMKEGASELVDTVGEAARRQPRAAAGIVAAAGLFVLRRPIARLFRRRKRRDDETERPRRR